MPSTVFDCISHVPQLYLADRNSLVVVTAGYDADFGWRYYAFSDDLLEVGETLDRFPDACQTFNPVALRAFKKASLLDATYLPDQTRPDTPAPSDHDVNSLRITGFYLDDEDHLCQLTARLWLADDRHRILATLRSEYPAVACTDTLEIAYEDMTQMCEGLARRLSMASGRPAALTELKQLLRDDTADLRARLRDRLPVSARTLLSCDKSAPLSL